MRRRVEEDEQEDIIVKVGRTGNPVVEIILNGNRTVQDALNAASIEVTDSSRIKVGGQTAVLDDELEDGDIVSVAGSIKGGSL